jgi:glucose uptake protein
MLIISSYAVAVVLLIITMLCWGSWANTQKLATQKWPFQLFYWDYVFGIVLLSLLFGLTIGSMGESGRGFLEDLQQGDPEALRSALIGGVVFNLANLLLVAAIDVAGMSVAFPIGIGLALVIGVVDNYLAKPIGNAGLLFAGVVLVAGAIVVNAIAYRRLPDGKSAASLKGILLSVAAGIMMGFFYGFVAKSLVADFAAPEPGRLTPYSAVFVFSLGILASNFLWNSFFMYRPLAGTSVSYGDYFRKGTPRLHLIGLLGGAIWCVGMSFNILASGVAGPAISYGLGQGATLIAAAWGVFIWKEFARAPKGTDRLLYLMFLFFFVGLSLIIFARLG